MSSSARSFPRVSFSPLFPGRTTGTLIPIQTRLLSCPALPFSCPLPTTKTWFYRRPTCFFRPAQTSAFSTRSRTSLIRLSGLRPSYIKFETCWNSDGYFVDNGFVFNFLSPVSKFESGQLYMHIKI